MEKRQRTANFLGINQGKKANFLPCPHHLPFVVRLLRVLTVRQRASSSSMRGLFSTHFGILLLLAVLEATAIHDNDHDKALETPNSSILTWRKIQQQHQQQSQGDNSNQRRVQEGNNDDRDDQQGNDEGSQDIDFDDRDEYVDSSREIDCNLVPRYCEEKGIDQGHGEQSNEPGPIYPIAGGNSEDNKPDDMTPRNLISLRVSVGLTNADRRSQSHLARYTARVITSLLDRYSPFMVKFALPGPENRVLESFFEFEEEQQVLYPISQWDSPESKLQMLLTPKAEVAGKRTRKNQRVLLSKRLTLNGGSAVTDKNHGESTEEQEPRHQRQLDHDNLEHPAALGEPEYLLQQYGDRDEENDRTFQNTDPDHGIGDTHTHNRILSNDNKPPSPARLFHWHTEVAVQSYDQDWMVVQVSYTVYKNKEKPILNPRDLQNITGICVSVLNATIVSGHFLDYLQQLILHEDEDDNSQDPSGSLGDNNGSTTWNSEDGE
jgi:hypothetical protein